VGGCTRLSRKYPCPVRRPKIAVDICRGRVVYAVLSLRLCGVLYVFGFGSFSYLVVQSWMNASCTWHCSHEREVGREVVGGSVVASLARRSASLLLGMSVWPGTQWMVIGLPWWRRYVAVVCMVRASSWPGPVVRRENCKMADWLSMKMCIARLCNRWRRMCFQHVFKHSSMARSSASKTSEVHPMGITTRISRGSPCGM
jgi:hypothetical protein